MSNQGSSAGPAAPMIAYDRLLSGGFYTFWWPRTQPANWQEWDPDYHPGSGCCGVYHIVMSLDGRAVKTLVTSPDMNVLMLANRRDTGLRRATVINVFAYILALLTACTVIILSILGANNSSISTAVHIASAIITGVGTIVAAFLKGISQGLQQQAAANESQMKKAATRAVGLSVDEDVPLVPPSYDPLPSPAAVSAAAMPRTQRVQGTRILVPASHVALLSSPAREAFEEDDRRQSAVEMGNSSIPAEHAQPRADSHEEEQPVHSPLASDVGDQRSQTAMSPTMTAQRVVHSSGRSLTGWSAPQSPSFSAHPHDDDDLKVPTQPSSTTLQPVAGSTFIPTVVAPSQPTASPVRYYQSGSVPVPIV